MPVVSAPRLPRKSTKPVTTTFVAALRGLGTLEISRGDKVESYQVVENPCDRDEFPGRSFRLTKTSTGKIYDCLLADDSDHSTCDCADFIFVGDHNRPYQCKHLIALRNALESGNLDSTDPEFPASEAYEIDEATAGTVQEAASVPAGPAGPVDGRDDDDGGDESDTFALAFFAANAPSMPHWYAKQNGILDTRGDYKLGDTAARERHQAECRWRWYHAATMLAVKNGGAA